MLIILNSIAMRLKCEDFVNYLRSKRREDHSQAVGTVRQENRWNEKRPKRRDTKRTGK